MGVSAMDCIQSSRVMKGMRRMSSRVFSWSGWKPAASKRLLWKGVLAYAHSHRRRSLTNCRCSSWSRGIVSFLGFQYSDFGFWILDFGLSAIPFSLLCDFWGFRGYTLAQVVCLPSYSLEPP